LEQITKYFKEILQEEKPEPERIPHLIASYFAGVILKDKTLLGARLITQDDLAFELGVTRPMARNARKILLNEYGLIVAKPRRGTFVVLQISAEKRERAKKLIQNGTEQVPLIRMDKTLVYGLSNTFDRQIKDASRTYLKLEEKLKNLMVVPRLISLLTMVFSSILNYNFCEAELYYTNDYSELLTLSCSTFAGSASTIVIIMPISTTVFKAIQAAKRKIRFIDHRIVSQILDELEKVCEREPVDIVYLGTSIPIQYLQEDNQDCWKRLYGMQIKWNFKIIVDDRHPTIAKVPNFFDGVEPGTNRGVIYFTILSNNELINPLNVIAGPSNDVKMLKKTYARHGMRLNASLSYAIVTLLTKYENIKRNLHYVTRQSYLDEAKTLLLASGLFIDSHIINNLGHFFYLKLRSGEYPKNVDRTFRAKKIAILDLEIHSSPHSAKDGIFISLANYTKSSDISHDLGKLLDFIKSITK